MKNFLKEPLVHFLMIGVALFFLYSIVGTNEIDNNILQFITSHDSSTNEIKSYTELIHDQLTIWTSLSPPVKEKYILKATKLYAKRSRRTRKAKDTIEINVN